jgi:hypothetical protein
LDEGIVMLNNDRGQEERRLLILEGIDHDLNNLEIATRMGISRWVVMRDLRSMKFNRDPELKQAYIDQTARLVASKLSLTNVRDDRFHLMTGMTITEKNFENMINFYRPELTKIIMSRDESIAISGLNKNIQRVLKHNEIIGGGKNRRKITTKARDYLPQYIQSRTLMHEPKSA